MSSVSQVETPSPTGPILHTSQATIEEQIGASFSCQFQGANGTPSYLLPSFTVLAWMAPLLLLVPSWMAPLPTPRG